MRSGKHLGLITGLLLGCAGLLSGCKPDLTPPKFVDRHPIHKVDATQYPRFTYTDQLIDGVAYRISPYPVGRPGGAITVGQLGDGPKTFNQWASYDHTSSTLGGLLSAGLVDTDPFTGGMIPALAKSWIISPDNLTYRVTLRQGLKWSDGHPLTSRDVAFTWNTIIAKGLGNPSNRDVLTIKGKLPTVTVLDDLTVAFKTPEPFAPFLRQLGQGIAPAHVFEPLLKAHGEKAFASFWTVQDAVDHPERLVSCGPWVLHRYEAGEKAVYRPNPYYWGRDKSGQRLPYVKQYVIRFVKDLNGLALQFEQGNLDTYGVSGKDLMHIRQLKHPDFTLYNLGPTPSTTFVAFNLSKRLRDGAPVVDPKVSGWFHTQAFRQAIDWAVDRQVLVRNILKGVGEPLFTSEGKASPFVNPALVNGHPRDLDKARQLLKSAGFRWNAAGELLDPKGNRVRFSLYTNTGNDEREAAGVSFKQDMADIGIQVDFKPMEFNVLVGKMQGTLDWETLLMGLSGGSFLEPNDGANVWRSNGGLHVFNQRDVQALGDRMPTDRLPWEADIDQLLYEGAVTLDMPKRKAIYHRLQAILYEQQPLVYLYTPLQLGAVRTRLKNVYPTPLGGLLHNLESVWVTSQEDN